MGPAPTHGVLLLDDRSTALAQWTTLAKSTRRMTRVECKNLVTRRSKYEMTGWFEQEGEAAADIGPSCGSVIHTLDDWRAGAVP